MDLQILNKIIGTYCLTLIAFGTVSNLLGIYICTRKDLRKIPAFVFYASLFVCDTIALYPLCLHYTLYAWYGTQMFDYSMAVCRIGHFLQFFAGETSTWILAFLTIERYVSIQVRLWRTTYFNIRKALFAVIVIVTIIFCINVPILAMPIKSYTNNTSPLADFYMSEMVLTELQINTYIGSLIPVPLLTIVNVMLIVKVVCKRTNIERSDRDKSKRRALTKSIIATTAAYTLLNLPTFVTSGFFLKKILATQYGFLITYLIFALRFTYCCINFYVLTLTNTLFKTQLKATFYKTTNGIQTAVTNTTNTPGGDK